MEGNKYYKPYFQTSHELYKCMLLVTRGLDEVPHWISTIPCAVYYKNNSHHISLIGVCIASEL